MKNKNEAGSLTASLFCYGQFVVFIRLGIINDRGRGNNEPHG